ncbi:hypothetical protein [Duganella phyllosphaerae]|uniref:Uncharacterized protein n=1 Tax=Duganella phyllosphaerae TaxID=762836 RepID=A0A1E7X7W3_9BURK|nr:hypothetical protein [Duganella phyllosphaerae]OFA09042.1 hypothetical protein DUPY_02840 [Duganella phyllosphaerae]
MKKDFFQPQDHVQTELKEYLRRVFPDYFAEANVHPLPLGISYENNKGVVMASVTLRWQRKPDFKEGQHVAHFTYQETRGVNSLEYNWYCTSGLPND